MAGGVSAAAAAGGRPFPVRSGEKFTARIILFTLHISSETDMSLYTAYLSIGSNVGNKVENCLAGLKMLTGDGRIEPLDRSPMYITEPVGFPDQDRFLNIAAAVRTGLSPESLLDAIFRVQDTMGRRKGGVRFGPRIVDLDILFFGDLILETPELEIPHPRLHQRLFVMMPLCDIAPQLRHPVLKRRMTDILAQLPAGRERIYRYPCDC